MELSHAERLMKGMDTWKPRWAEEYANPTELFAYAQEIRYGGGLDWAYARLRQSVAYRLIIVVSAAIEVGIVTTTETTNGKV